MNKIFLALILFYMPIVASDIPTRVGEFPKEELKTQNKEIAKLVADEIMSTLPQTVDKYTTLISVKNRDTTLLYTFEINTGVKSDDAIRKEDKSRMKRAITNGICQSSKKFIDAGINTSYIYISATSKAHLFQFDVSQKDCITTTK